MRTKEKITITRTNFSTEGADLASHIRINKNNPLPEPFSLILNEALQLVEAPIMKPKIEPLTLPLIPNAPEVFESDNISISNNFLANNVVSTSHIAFLPTTQLLQVSFGGLCAFSLQLTPQKSELPNPSLRSLKNSSITTDSKIVYSEVNSENLVATRSFRIDLSGESDMPIKNSFSINEFESLIFPIKILPIIFRNKNSNITSVIFSKGCYPEFVEAECEKLPIPGNGLLLNNWLDFELSTFQAFTGFANSLNSEISRQPLANIFINKLMQGETITGPGFKTFIDDALHSTREDFIHLEEHFMFGRNLQFNSGNKLHNNYKDDSIYKYDAKMSCASNGIRGENYGN